MKGLKFIIPLLSLTLVFSGAQKGPQSVTAERQFNFEPAAGYVNTNTETSPIFSYDLRNSMNVTLMDSCMNAYGIILSQTRPLNVTDEGWVFGYRQWAGPNGTSGQIGGAYSSNGLNWTTYTNLNPGMGLARYPSSLGTPDYPYVFWNEYTGEGAGYGGRMYYSYDEFGWDGGSWSSANELDNLWNGNKDQWVLSPDHSYDAANDENWFNVVFDDWTRENIWGMHSEAYFDGTIIFGSEFILFNEDLDFIGGTDEGSFTSSGLVDINESGVGYAAVTAYFNDGDVGGSPYSNHHTLALKMTEDYGATWTGGQGGSDYFYLADDVFDAMVANSDFILNWDDECFAEPLIISQPFLTYDFDLRVDSQGNPHVLAGVIGSDDGSVYPGFIDNALFYFTIDKEYLLNPGETQTATGWNYSKVLATNDMWLWENADGASYWQDVFPSLAISEDNDDVMWVVTSTPVQGDFIVSDDAGTPDDTCDDLGYYPEWNEEVLVIKSVDGGASWWCPYNATNTVPDCWVTEGGEQECAPDEYCTDGSTMNEPSELNAHAGTGATDDQVNIMFGRPDWCYGSTTGDNAGDDHKNRYYVGWVDLTDEEITFCETDDCVPGAGSGDVNYDGAMDILDIVSIVNYIVFGAELTWECAGDFNGDGSVDILDIVGIMNCILFGCAREDVATYANVQQTDNGLNITADGFIGAVQVTLTHNKDFSIELTDNSYFGAFNNKGTETTVVVVGPATEEIFKSTGNFYISDIKVASGDDYLDIMVANSFALLSNYPNPFNPETTISYEMTVDGIVELGIYNVMGQKVASLVNDYRSVGTYSTIWNGMNDAGNEVSSGLYIMKLTSGQTSISNKITLLR